MNIEKIRALVGDITEKQLECIDCFIGSNIGLFVPAVGQCMYAITKEHTHPAYSFVLTFDNNLQVGDTTQTNSTVDKGMLIGMSPDFKHHEEQSDDFSRYYAIMIDTPFYNATLKRYGIAPNPHYPFTMARASNSLLPYLRAFMLESAQLSEATLPKVEALEILITHTIIEATHTTKKLGDTTTIHNRLEIDRAVEFMHANLGNKLSVEMIAHEVCLSPSHLSSIFKKEVGKTVMGYLTEVRLQQARKLLLQKKLSISEISFQCGFSSSSHLSQSFKNHYGMSPREVLKST